MSLICLPFKISWKDICLELAHHKKKQNISTLVYLQIEDKNNLITQKHSSKWQRHKFILVENKQQINSGSQLVHQRFFFYSGRMRRWRGNIRRKKEDTHFLNQNQRYSGSCGAEREIKKWCLLHRMNLQLWCPKREESSFNWAAAGPEWAISLL